MIKMCHDATVFKSFLPKGGRESSFCAPTGNLSSTLDGGFQNIEDKVGTSLFLRGRVTQSSDVMLLIGFLEIGDHVRGWAKKCHFSASVQEENTIKGFEHLFAGSMQRGDDDLVLCEIF